MFIFFADNVAYYKCDVSNWAEVDAVAKQVVEEVNKIDSLLFASSKSTVSDWTPYNHYQQRRRCSRETTFGSNARGCQTVTYNVFFLFLVPALHAFYHRTFNTNVLAHFWILKAFLPHMIKEKAGHIVRCSITSSIRGSNVFN